MNSLILVTGGSRSGKSAFSQRLAEQQDRARFYLATCPPGIDPETDERIAKHRRERECRGWNAIEEPLLLAGQIGRIPAGAVVLIDCLTLWISNLTHQAELSGGLISEERMTALTEELVQAARRHQGRVIMVANEVGLGIVPDNPAARRFRDLAGRCNQAAAAAADEVFFVCCGIPMRIK